MQNIESIIKNLKVALGFKSEEVITEEVKTEEVITEEVKFVDVKSGEMVLRVDGELAIGASVAEVTMDEAGTEVLNAVADGEYPIEDSKTLVILNSTISDIIESAEPEVEIEVELKQVEEVKEEEIKFDFSKVEEIITSAFELHNSEMAAMKVTIDELYRELEEVKKQPASAPIKMSKTEKVKHDINAERNSHMDELVKLIKNK
jgi:hypothetical protein